MIIDCPESLPGLVQHRRAELGLPLPRLPDTVDGEVLEGPAVKDLDSRS